MTDTGHGRTLDPAVPDTRRADERLRRLETVLRRLQLRIGEQFAAAVTDDRLNIDVANGMLEAFGMPPLPRRLRVHTCVPMICDVTAATRDDAFDAAAEAVENAVHATDAGAGIDIAFDTREDLHATPGEVDTEAVATDWADHHLST